MICCALAPRVASFPDAILSLAFYERGTFVLLYCLGPYICPYRYSSREIIALQFMPTVVGQDAVSLLCSSAWHSAGSIGRLFVVRRELSACPLLSSACTGDPSLRTIISSMLCITNGGGSKSPRSARVPARMRGGVREFGSAWFFFALELAHRGAIHYIRN